MQNKTGVRSENVDATEELLFAPARNGEDRYLGVRELKWMIDWTDASQIVLKADQLDYRNIFCSSSCQIRQDILTFATTMTPLTRPINLLAAVRSGEVHPLMLGRTIAALDHISAGRLTLIIISSDLSGTSMSSKDRYQVSQEVILILLQDWVQEIVDFKEGFYQVDLSADPVNPYPPNGSTLLYFCGWCRTEVDLCAGHCNLYLMWPDKKDRLLQSIKDCCSKEAAYNRTVDVGLRIHVVTWETAFESREAAQLILSKIDDKGTTQIKNRTLDAKTPGISKQSELRDTSDREGFVEELLWTVIGKARSVCGAALFSNPDQIFEKIQGSIKMRIRSLIFSGYPHLKQSAFFGRYLLPRLKTCSVPVILNRNIRFVTDTPTGNGDRK